MKVYIASKYLDHKLLNRQIYHELVQANIDAFLPESINVNAISLDEMNAVARICFSEIDKCNIILIVCPFGKSVSCEIGYAIAKMGISTQKKHLILLNPEHADNILKSEAMIAPFIEKEVINIKQLIEYLKTNDFE